MSKDSATAIWKTLTEDIKKRTWFKYYRGIEDFVIEAVRKSIEEWEKCALTHENGRESDAKGKAIEKRRSGAVAPSKTAKKDENSKKDGDEKTDLSQEDKPPGCPRYLGYLMKEHPRKTPLPNECLTCTKINECLVRAY